VSGRPPLYFDATTLLSFACDVTAGSALAAHFAGHARVAQIVLEELRLQQLKQPPIPHANRAVTLATAMTVEGIEDLDDLDRLAKYRDRLAAPGDHPRKHLGEAACVVLAERTGGAIVASDDSGARLLAKDAGVRIVATPEILRVLVNRSQQLTCPQAEAALAAMIRAGRQLDPDATVC
jgi:predicted nucleic acid-binding protein